MKEIAMNKTETQMNDLSQKQHLNRPENKRVKSLKSSLSRRSFLGKSLAVGAGTIGGGWLLGGASPAFAAGGLTPGDAALLRFPAALEILEAAFWIQSNEIGCGHEV